MGANLKPELKQAIWEKYRQGAYDKDLSSPQAMAELILYKELHQKILKNVENTAYQRGRDEKTKKLLNVPPLEKGAGNRVVQPKQFNNFEILGEDFGDK